MNSILISSLKLELLVVQKQLLKFEGVLIIVKISYIFSQVGVIDWMGSHLVLYKSDKRWKGEYYGIDLNKFLRALEL
jgi:hypothetical protein